MRVEYFPNGRDDRRKRRAKERDDEFSQELSTDVLLFGGSMASDLIGTQAPIPVFVEDEDRKPVRRRSGKKQQ